MGAATGLFPQLSPAQPFPDKGTAHPPESSSEPTKSPPSHKGPVLAASAYGNLALWQFCDLVLIHKQDAFRVKLCFRIRDTGCRWSNDLRSGSDVVSIGLRV